MTRFTLCAFVLLSVCVLSNESHAQQLSGTVLEEQSNQPVSGAIILLINAEDDTVSTILSETNGQFAIQISAPGNYRLTVQRIGYMPANSGLFLVGDDDDIPVDIYLTAAPVSLDTLDVVGDNRHPKLESVGFYERLEDNVGHFIQREEIESRPVQQVTDLLYGFRGGRVTIVNSLTNEYDVIMRAAATTYIRGGAARRDAVCYPTVVIDGTVVRHGGAGVEIGSWNALVSPAEIEAIEAYPNNVGLPVRYAGIRTPCGAILIWTRR